MKFREAAVAGEFANWTAMFEPTPKFRGVLPQVLCTKCETHVDTDKVQDHLLEQHRYDLQDGIVIQVYDKWWRRRGIKT